MTLRRVALIVALAIGLSFTAAPRVASAAVAIVHSNTCLQTSSSTSFACTITAPTTGNVLVASGGSYTGGAGCVLTATSFTAVSGAANQAGDRCTGIMWMLVPGSPSTTVTLSATVSGDYMVLVDEWSGLNTVTPVDKSAVGNSGGASSTTCVTAGVIPAQTGDALQIVNVNSTATATGVASSSPANTWTTTNIHDNTTGVFSESSTAISASTSSLTTTWTWGSAQLNTCSMVALSPAGAATPAPQPKWIGAYVDLHSIPVYEFEEAA